MAKSVNAARIGGLVALIGVLANGSGLDPMRVLMKSIRLQGIFVGSRRMFTEMNTAITVNRLKPVIDKTFAFDQAREALEFMKAGSHFGKIVITI